jgi:hypothetical protein
MCRIVSMGHVDRRKHDVDVIERVLGGIHDAIDPSEPARRIDVEVPSSSGSCSIVELIVNVGDDYRKPRTGPRDY